MLTVKELGVLGGACGLVVGVWVTSQSIATLVHERDMYRAQAQGRQQPHQSTPPAAVAPSPKPSGPAAGPAPSASPSPSQSTTVLQVAAALGHASMVVVPPSHTPPPAHSSRPSSTPHPRPLLSVRADVTAAIGGSR